MIIDYRANADHAHRHRILDARTGEDLSWMNIVHADDEAGIVRIYVKAFHPNGNYIFLDDGDGRPIEAELRRPIRIVPKGVVGPDDERARLRARVAELEEAILRVVTQQEDDLCWMDIYTELAGLVRVTFDPRLLPDDMMLANCRRFVKSLRTGCPYQPIDPVYSGRDSKVVVTAPEDPS
jgi:hypothetical protein